MTDKSNARLPVGKRAAFIMLGLALAVLGVLAFVVLTYPKSSELISFSMGSYVQQTVWGKDPDRAAAETVQGIEELEGEISWRLDGSIALINSQAGGEPVALGESTAGLLAETLELCERSGGAFDITLGPVTRLWNFDSEPRLPEPEELEKALELTGWQDVELTDGGSVKLARSGMALDLGAVGKGAACDTAMEGYRIHRVQAAVIAVGGSVGLYGRKPDGKDWQVGVRDPEGAGSLGMMSLPGGFVSTSGSYEKFFEQDGKVYCHLLDPRTGYPAQSGLRSVTVWCPAETDAKYPGALSDGLGTACFVLGLEGGMELLESYGAEGVFIDENNEIVVTGGLKDRFTLTAGGYSIREAG